MSNSDDWDEAEFERQRREFEKEYNRPGGLRLDKDGNPRPFNRYESFHGTYFDIYLDEDGQPMPGQAKPEWDRETGWGQSVTDFYGED